jgi:hypothetical protein
MESSLENPNFVIFTNEYHSHAYNDNLISCVVAYILTFLKRLHTVNGVVRGFAYCQIS